MENTKQNPQKNYTNFRIDCWIKIKDLWNILFSNFSCMFLNPMIFPIWIEQVKKGFCFPILFWPFTVWNNCSSDLKICSNSWPSASNYKSFSESLKHFFLTEVRTILVTKYNLYIWGLYLEPRDLLYSEITFNYNLYQG